MNRRSLRTFISWHEMIFLLVSAPRFFPIFLFFQLKFNSFLNYFHRCDATRNKLNINNHNATCSDFTSIHIRRRDSCLRQVYVMESLKWHRASRCSIQLLFNNKYFVLLDSRKILYDDHLSGLSVSLLAAFFCAFLL